MKPSAYTGIKQSTQREHADARWEHAWCVGEEQGGRCGWSGVSEGGKRQEMGPER